jgi:hypothetical protein
MLPSMEQNNPSPPPIPPPGPTLPYQTPTSFGTGVSCPKCGGAHHKAVAFTWWGGLLGPRLFHQVKCLNCGAGFNGKTGRSNTTAITIYIAVTTVIAIVVFVALLFLR